MSDDNSGGDLRAARHQYGAVGLRRAALDADPLAQFARWIEHARETEGADFNAMVLATADGGGQPSARVVLLKHYDSGGFCWYTDKDSDKGQQLAANPRAALLFFWPQLHRQVRIEGEVATLSEAEADAYYDSRPTASRLSAAVSMQSRVIADRAALEGAVATLRAQLGGDAPQRPARWGGYRLQAAQFEFWQGRDDRLHDRFRYRAAGDGWVIERLCP